MIPVSLQLTNFLSYGTGVAPLDFERFDVACLSGNNGNGKSALLDALTWSLWGEARNSTPHLLRLGETDMNVEFVFDLDGDRYRATRRWAKKKRSGDTLLELSVRDESSGLYRALTGTSVRETQSKINAILRMDYETFVASAYLKQGEADRFSRKPPGQRKDVLAEILGLSRYQEIADAARQEMRARETQVAALEARIDDFERQLSARDDAQKLYDLFSEKLRVLAPQIDATEEKRGELRARKTRLEADKKRGETLESELAALKREATSLKSEGGQLLARKRTLDEWQAQSETITDDFQKLRAAREEAEKWRAIDARWRELGDEYNAMKTRVAELRHELDAKKATAQAQLSHDEKIIADNENIAARAEDIRRGHAELLESRQTESEYSRQRAGYDEATRAVSQTREKVRAKRLEIDGRLHSLESQIADNEKVAASLEEWKTRADAAQKQVETLDADAAQRRELEEQSSELGARLEQLKTLVEGEKNATEASRQKLRVLAANPQAQCPLCETQLGEHGREHIQENIEDEIALAQSRIEEYTDEARLVKTKKAALDAPLSDIKKRLDAAPRLYKSAESAGAQLARAQDAATRVLALQTERETLRAQAESGEFAPQESASLRDAEAALQNISYDARAHASAARRIAELAHFEGEIAELRVAEKHAADASTRAAVARETLRTIESEIESGDFAREETTQLARLKAQATALNYDKPERELFANAQREEKRLERAGDAWNKLQNAMSGAADLENALQNQVARAAANDEKLGKSRSELEAVKDVAAQIVFCERALQEAADELVKLRADEKDASQEVGKNLSTLERCAQIEIERAALEEERKKAAHQVLSLRYTSQSFGKDGIQALIIENAIPEIQDYANEILARLTRNHMQISLESQREKVTGGARETLDIKISDERGTREYSLFSGGEAFRADFALRIALSKLLARRAGTQLRTLIIDEGFGTQDSEGLRQMIECIQSIAPDFSKVLVVTHLEELKNAFPVRIEVSKQPDTGSRYEILGG